MPNPFANVRPRSTPAAAPVAVSGVDPTEYAKLQRQLAEAANAKAELEAKAKASEDAARAIQSDRDTRVYREWVEKQATAIGALNVPHVSTLVQSEFAVELDDKKQPVVRVKGNPAADPAAHLSAWFQREGTAYLKSPVASGAGATSLAGVTPQAPPMDLKSADGATNFVRSIVPGASERAKANTIVNR